MARTTDEILATMDVEQSAQTELSALNSTSRVSIFRLIKYVFAQCANILEQLWDRKQTSIENALQYGVPPSLFWIRSKTFEFQYGDTLTLVDLIPTYAVIDESKQIVTRCTVRQSAGVVYILTAKNEPPEKLSAPEVTALQSYWISAGDGTNQAVGLGYGGQVLSVISLDPDLLFIEATITYDGKYANTIEDDCILALETYISNLGITPIFRTVDMINALRGVTGFVDIFINELSARAAATAWGSGTDLVAADVTVATEYTATAGYMIGETTATFTFADKLTFTAI